MILLENSNFKTSNLLFFQWRTHESYSQKTREDSKEEGVEKRDIAEVK